MSPKLKKALKITGITVGSLLGLLILAVVLVCVLVFTSPSLTNVAEKGLDKFCPARAKIDKVDLTLVSTYPYLAFRLNGLVVYDDMESSPSDTLAAIDEFTVTIDFKSLYKENKIILTNLFIDGVNANLFTAADGSSNLDVFGIEQTEEPEPEPEPEPEVEEPVELDIYADLQKIKIDGVNASYIDLSSGTEAVVQGLGMELKGLLNYDSLEAKTSLKLESVIAAVRNDSTDLSASLKELKVNGKVTKFNDDVNADLNVSLGSTNAAMGDMAASVNGIRFVLDNMSCRMGSEGLSNLLAGISVKIDDVCVNQPGLKASTGAIALKSPMTVLTGDSANISDLTLSTNSINVEMLDSAGNLTKASVDNILLGMDAAVKLDMNDIASVLALAVEGTTFEMGGESPVKLDAANITLDADAGIKSGDIALNLKFRTPSVNAAMGDEVYVPGWPISLNLPLETNMDVTRFAILNGAGVSIDGQRIGFSANGTMNGADIAGRVRVNTIDDLDIDHLVSMIPESFRSMLDGIDVHGTVGLDINVRGGMNDNGPVLDGAVADIRLQQLDASVNDSLKAASGKLTLHANYPSNIAVDKDRQTADVAVQATDLQLTMVDSTTINASVDGLGLNASVAGLMEDVDKMNLIVDIKADCIEADMDTIFGTLSNTLVNLAMTPADGSIAMKAKVSLDGLTAGMGSMLSATMGPSSLQAFAQYDSTKQEILNQWNPQVKMSLKDGQVDMLASPICLKTLDFDFSLGRFNINDCRVEIDDSDIQFWGDIYNIGEFIDNTGLLTGELYIESDYMDLNRLMSLTGDDQATDEEAAEQDVADNDSVITKPIMIPKGIDLTLYTNLSKVDFNNHSFNNVGGDVSIKDGVITLQELGFSSKAAEMQLTAIYRTPDVERRFMELDFHLLDIEIDELIDLVPAVDSVVPMLKALSGQAQFHLAAQTYLDPDCSKNGPLYPLMYSLMGNAVIEGANLVVLDNELFDGIKRKLLMRKDAKPVIDSLDIELQVLDGKVDLYPARIKMDRYEAIISGRHNIDAGLNCSYNISLTKCPLPIRLGVTISGPLEAISQYPIRHIKVGRAKYDKMYTPSKGKAEQAILARKNAILEASRSNVRPRSSAKHVVNQE